MNKIILILILLAAVWGFLNVSAYYAGRVDPYTASGSYLSPYSRSIYRSFEAVRIPYYSCDSYVTPRGRTPVCGWDHEAFKIY